MDVIGKNVSVYWAEEAEYFEGRIDDYNPDFGYHIVYYMGDQEWVENLDNVKFNDNDKDDDDINLIIQDLGQRAESKDVLYVLDVDDDPQKEEFDAKLAGFYDTTSNSINTTTELKVIPNNDYDYGNMNNNNYYYRQQQSESNDNNDNLQSTQDYNVDKLPDNCILLSGSIYGANDLPSKLDETNDDIQTFYRVLYVKAGEKGNSAMFRCKTTIFKSENVGNQEALLKISVPLVDAIPSLLHGPSIK